MSNKDRYGGKWWYPTIVKALRRYPYLKAEKLAIQAQSVTPSYSGMPRGGGVSRTTEIAATRRHFSQQEELLIDAVDKATAEISRHSDGQEVLEIIKMVDYTQRYTVTGAAMKLHSSTKTVQRKRSRFICLVGKYCGWV